MNASASGDWLAEGMCRLLSVSHCGHITVEVVVNDVNELMKDIGRDGNHDEDHGTGEMTVLRHLGRDCGV